MGAVNTTEVSVDRDEHDCEYFTSFDHFPYSETAREAFYKGRYSRSGKYSYKHDDVCRIRAKLGKVGRFRDWKIYVRIGEISQSIAKDFNKNVLKEKDKVTFSVPVRAEMKSVFNQWSPIGWCMVCCHSHKKKLALREIVLLEPYFSKFENEYFSDSTGNCENEDLTDEDREITQAFSHYSWHQSGGKYLICGLKGRKMDKKYYFRGPTIHSNPAPPSSAAEPDPVPETFGSKDDDWEGIKTFFQNHECNRLCESFSKL